MISNNFLPIDEETIVKAGLRPSEKHVIAKPLPNARVFEFPQLENVFVIESDLYGNPLPKDSCFLVFKGRNGLMGKDLPVEILKNASLEDIRNIVKSNTEG